MFQLSLLHSASPALYFTHATILRWNDSIYQRPPSKTFGRSLKGATCKFSGKSKLVFLRCDPLIALSDEYCPIFSRNPCLEKFILARSGELTKLAQVNHPSIASGHTLALPPRLIGKTKRDLGWWKRNPFSRFGKISSGSPRNVFGSDFPEVIPKFYGQIFQGNWRSTSENSDYS